MIEIGSWVGLAAMTQSEITIKNVRWEYLGQLPNVFRKLGITLEKRGDDLFVPAHKEGYEIQNFIDGSILTISDAPWPGIYPRFTKYRFGRSNPSPRQCANSPKNV